jgi:hypothetical protein
MEIGFGEDLREIQIARKEFANACGDCFDDSLAWRILGVRDERPLLGRIPKLGECGQILLGT